MKAILLALALQGSTAWDANQEIFAGITCPTRASAERVANIHQTYMVGDTLETSRCLFVVFQGTRLAETNDFSIGGTLYNFTVVNYEGYTVYVLNNNGPGYVA